MPAGSNVRFANRRGLTSAMIPGDEPLPGAIPMETHDQVVSPDRQPLAITPATPKPPGIVGETSKTVAVPGVEG